MGTRTRGKQSIKDWLGMRAVPLHRMVGCILLLSALTGLSHPAWADPMPWPVSQQQWRWTRMLRGIATQSGMTVPSLYIFFDPNCPWCSQLWQTRLPDGRFFKDMPAVWVPVTYLKNDSLGKAAALLRQGSKAALERDLGAAYNPEHRSGGIEAIEPNQAELSDLGHSKAVWLQLGGATPMFVYRSSSGQVLRYLGLPKDPAMLMDILRSAVPPRLETYRP